MRVIGQTIDDAVGEAYDKAAVILDAGYPGGQKLDALARTGDPQAESLPRSLLAPESLDFSFSGLKTALLYKVRGHPVGRGQGAVFPRTAADLSPRRKADLAAAFQQAAVETLILKLERGLDFLASRGQAARGVVIGGGVSANSLLRQSAADLAQRRGLPVHIPMLEYCLDNAAMIAGLAHHHLIEGRTDSLDLPAMANASL
jgi:N6-L-threonylcarbamoyladenine synthase